MTKQLQVQWRFRWASNIDSVEALDWEVDNLLLRGIVVEVVEVGPNLWHINCYV